MLRIRFAYPTGSSLAVSIERFADGLYYDFSTATFCNAPHTLTSPLPEGDGPFVGRYLATLASTPRSVFSDGDYVVYVHDTKSKSVVACLGATMHGGNDATVFPRMGPP